MDRLSLLTAASLLVLLPSGCISMYMAPTSPPQPIHAVVDRATVVFVRPRQLSVAEGQIVTLVDVDGHFVGQLNDGDHFAITTHPGPHHFVGFFREHADSIRADLLAGHIYYVLVTMTPGDWYAQLILRAIDHEQPEWSERHALLNRTRQLLPMLDAGQAALDPREVRRKIGNARHRWARSSEDERRARTLSPGDGERDPTLPPAPAPRRIGSLSSRLDPP